MVSDRLSGILLLVGIFCLLLAIVIILLDFIFRRRSLRRMNDMIRQPLTGILRRIILTSLCVRPWKTDWRSIWP